MSQLGFLKGDARLVRDKWSETPASSYRWDWGLVDGNEKRVARVSAYIRWPCLMQRSTMHASHRENLQDQIDAASFLKDPLQASLATLVAQIEEMVPELDHDKKDIDATQALLREAEVAYQ